MQKRWRLLTLLLATLVVAVTAGVTACLAAPSSTSPNTPGAVRVIHNGEWVYFNELADGTGVVEVSAEPGNIVLQKTPRGYRLEVTWTWFSHTFVDVRYDQNDTPASTVR